ncbi:MAG: diacylglycerol kinase [Firmicutes bacterium HGW-Firmicutes-1]|jgi:YegS/Rv2252/BmrU family lipid kinase|nr:MAG: diacylglycerol kinase [Firmicutes bacterium HGW-Firmicutes-1]
MKRHVFIINPEAGKKKGINLKDYIQETYNNPLILVTSYKGHATELAKTYARQHTIIYSLGGDGTLNEIINGVLQSKYYSETIVAAVPCGSGNDFIKGITNIKDPVEILKRYQKQKLKVIDLGKINDRYYTNIASIGFDALVVHQAEKYKRIPMVSGEFSYLISIFRNLIRLKDYSVFISVDNQSIMKKRILFITMANGRYYGGGMQPAPKALLDDGELDFGIIAKVSRMKALILLPRFINGKHESLDEVSVCRGKKLMVKSEQAMPINIDGEIIWSDNISVQIEEKALQILVP